MSELTILTHTPNRTLAQPVVDYLQYHEIEAFVQSDDCGGVDPALNFIHGTRVLVWKTDLERAQTFLETFHRQGQEALEAMEKAGEFESPPRL